MSTTLYLRHGGALSTEPPSMEVISDTEMAAAMALHAETQYFHSDFAHTDFAAAGNTSTASASWVTPPLPTACKLSSMVANVMLWVGTSATHAGFSASLSKQQGAEWVSLGGGSADTLFREGADEPQPLPGKGMMAASANGGFAVGLPLQLRLLQEGVQLEAGDVLRLDVGCGAAAGDDDDDGGGATADSGAADRVDRRIWHNAKWASTVELSVEPVAPAGSGLDLKFEPHPVIEQPASAAL